MIDHALHVWLNVATLFVFVGGLLYLTLLQYMTRDE